MIATMTPSRQEGTWHYCRTDDVSVAAAVLSVAFAVIKEERGFTLILREETASEFSFKTAMPMGLITLEVFSALDGFGLTAAFAPALAEAHIACNVIAAHDHDHLFVPIDRVEDAMAILLRIQQGDS